MASCYDHCLNDLLYRWRAGSLGVDVALVVSDHEDVGTIADPEAKNLAVREICYLRTTSAATDHPCTALLQPPAVVRADVISDDR